VLQNSVASPAAQHSNPYVDLDESLLRESTRLRINIAPRTFKNSFATVSRLAGIGAVDFRYGGETLPQVVGFG